MMPVPLAVDGITPPNIEDRPVPLPECSSTNTISPRANRLWMTSTRMTRAFTEVLSCRDDARRRFEHGRSIIAARLGRLKDGFSARSSAMPRPLGGLRQAEQVEHARRDVGEHAAVPHAVHDRARRR